ncbi:uncharacterized protein TNIN_450201 [Trichonephila inaurata madagascariensis]|uniref:Uncharacterized protein n=1 Tax=Trichonephila inaurata madagascariensis TaxID=2747483 RepID=A0A8X6Y467_9ARAC|nr:uncharacterized protein TNIN_450201 [Trichonephila inaurata madagascariensis]
MPFRLKLHSSVNSTCAVKSCCTVNRWRNHREKSSRADGWLLSMRAQVVYDRGEGLRLPTIAKPSCGSHLRRRIQSARSSPVAPEIHGTRAVRFGLLALLVRSVSCIPLTNEPVSLRRRCKRSKVFLFGKCLKGDCSPYNHRASTAFPSATP